MRRLDAALAAWVVLWVVLAVVVHQQVRTVGELADSLVTAGRALDSTADGLESVGGVVEGLPFVDEIANLDAIERQVRQGARDARATARDARAGADRLAWLLAAITGLVPTAPLVAVRVALRRKLPAP